MSNFAIGTNVLTYIDNLLTPEELAESNQRVEIGSKVIEARKEKEISQKEINLAY